MKHVRKKKRRELYRSDGGKNASRAREEKKERIIRETRPLSLEA